MAEIDDKPGNSGGGQLTLLALKGKKLAPVSTGAPGSSRAPTPATARWAAAITIASGRSVSRAASTLPRPCPA
ncbi:hypothetical protein LNQ03_27195 [Klebsiella pneumoniae subsp. pneumoniae]|nr:hypothetical protein [Klebsiella pneumoniae subsp. pneumoniae]